MSPEREELPFHTGVRGTSRKGKSQWLIRNRIHPSLKNPAALTAVIDPAADMARDAVLHAVFLGYEPQDIVIDNLDDLHHVLPIRLIGISDLPDRRERAALNSLFRSEFVSMVAMATHTVNMDELQTVVPNLDLTALVYQYQGRPKSQADIYAILCPGLPEFQAWKADCTDRMALQRLSHIEGLWKAQNKSEYYRYVMPTLRRLERILGDESIKSRLQGTPYDLEPLWERGGLYVMMSTAGGAMSDAARSFLYRNRNLEFGRLARRRKAMKDETTEIDVVFDEWRAVRAIHEPEIVNLNTLLKLGVCWTYSTQNDLIGDEVLDDDFQNACSDQVTFHCSSTNVAKRAAESMITAIDFYKVKRQKSRTRSKIVGYREVPNVTKGVSVDHEGNERVTENMGTRYEPVMQDVEELEDEHFGANDQVLGLAMEVKQLGVGWFKRVKDGVVTGPLYEPMLKMPRGYDRSVFDEQYQYLIDSGILRPSEEPLTDVESGGSWTPQTPTPISSEPSSKPNTGGEPKGEPTSKTRKSGMKKSSR